MRNQMTGMQTDATAHLPFISIYIRKSVCGYSWILCGTARLAMQLDSGPIKRRATHALRSTVWRLDHWLITGLNCNPWPVMTLGSWLFTFLSPYVSLSFSMARYWPDLRFAQAKFNKSPRSHRISDIVWNSS